MHAIKLLIQMTSAFLRFEEGLMWRSVKEGHILWVGRFVKSLEEHMFFLLAPTDLDRQKWLVLYRSDFAIRMSVFFKLEHHYQNLSQQEKIDSSPWNFLCEIFHCFLLQINFHCSELRAIKHTVNQMLRAKSFTKHNVQTTENSMA